MNKPRIEPCTDTPQLRQEIIAACLELSRLGFFIGTWGNIAVRIADGLLMTPSRMDYRVMTPDDLVVVSMEGKTLRGNQLPSSELHLHRLLLLSRPDFGATVHAHSPYASAVACAGRSLPVCVEDAAQIIGAEVHCSRYVRGGCHLDLARAAQEAIGPDAAAVLLANHGPVVGGRNLAEALVAAQVLEKAAQVFVWANSLGGCRIIPEESVRAERERFLYKYGKAADTEREEAAGR